MASYFLDGIVHDKVKKLESDETNQLRAVER
jgi:hypothetical protein